MKYWTKRKQCLLRLMLEQNHSFEKISGSLMFQGYPDNLLKEKIKLIRSHKISWWEKLKRWLGGVYG